MFEILIERELPRPVGDDDPIAELWDFWDAARGDAPAICRDEFNAFDFPKLLGRINLVEVEPGRPTRFRFRVFGSEMDDPLQGDMTMRSVADIKEPAYADLVQRHYLQAYRLRRPFFAEVKARVGQESLFHYCRLALPMASAPGRFDILLVVSLRYADDKVEHVAGQFLDLCQTSVHRYSGATPESAHEWKAEQGPQSGACEP